MIIGKTIGPIATPIIVPINKPIKAPHPELLYTVYKRFGLEKARDFVETARLALISPWVNGYYSGSASNVFVQDAANYTQSKFHLININFFI